MLFLPGLSRLDIGKVGCFLSSICEQLVSYWLCRAWQFKTKEILIKANRQTGKFCLYEKRLKRSVPSSECLWALCFCLLVFNGSSVMDYLALPRIGVRDSLSRLAESVMNRFPLCISNSRLSPVKLRFFVNIRK